jgi:hypothetical protein
MMICFRKDFKASSVLDFFSGAHCTSLLKNREGVWHSDKEAVGGGNLVVFRRTL